MGKGFGRSRLSDKEEVGVRSHQIRGGRSPKNVFRPFGPQFGLKMRGVGGVAPLGPTPGSTGTEGSIQVTLSPTTTKQ